MTLSKEAPIQQAKRVCMENFLGIDFNNAYELLKNDMLSFEREHDGFNLVGSKTYEFARHILKICWIELEKIKVKSPAIFEKWKSGQMGYFQIETNNVALGLLLNCSKTQRLSLDTEEKYRLAAKYAARTAYNWRRKTTQVWQHEDGTTSSGFPLFLTWTRLNRAGIPDEKGRGNLVATVNGRYLFGPEWQNLLGVTENSKTADNQSDNQFYDENFSSIQHKLKKTALEKNKKEEIGAAMPQLSVSRDATNENINRQMAESGFSEVGASASENNFPPRAASPLAERAAALWLRLIQIIYLPYFGTGRIRLSTENPFFPQKFSGKTTENAENQLVEMIGMVARDAEISIEEAVQILITAAEKQAEYMVKTPESWVLTPKNFLSARGNRGTLLSAMRTWVNFNPTTVNPTQEVENNTPDEREKRAYQAILSLGCVKTHPGTFAKWVRDHGIAHVEACISAMRLNAKKRREQGKEAGKEFNCPSGYFAGLVKRVNVALVEEDAKRKERAEIKAKLSAKGAQFDMPIANRPDNDIAQMEQIKWFIHGLASDAEKFAVMDQNTRAYFGLGQGFQFKTYQDFILMWYVGNVA